MSEMFTLNIASSQGARTISWSIIRETDKAVLVQTSGGELWLPLWRFEIRKYSPGSVHVLIKLLTDISKYSEYAFVPVKKAGSGKTEKSAKYKVEVTEDLDPYGEHTLQNRVRTFTLPVSQITHTDGLMFAPIWLLKKHLDKNEFVKNRSWPGLDKVRLEIEQIAAEVSQLEVEHNAKMERQRLQERAEQDENERQQKADLERLNLALEEDGEAGLVFCKKYYNLNDLNKRGVDLYCWPTWLPNTAMLNELNNLFAILEIARAHPKFEAWKKKHGDKPFQAIMKEKKVRQPDKVLVNCCVNWVEWGGTTKQLVKIDQEECGCTVKIYGKKREIILPDGSVITKMEGPNLKIVSNEGVQNQANE